MLVNVTIILSYEPRTAVWWAGYKEHEWCGDSSKSSYAGAELPNAPWVAICRLLQRCPICLEANTDDTGPVFPPSPRHCSPECLMDQEMDEAQG